MRRPLLAGLLPLAVLAVSCEAEPEATHSPVAQHPCVVGEGTGDEKLLQAALRTERFELRYSPAESLVQRLEQDLRRMKPGASTVARDMCHYLPEPSSGSGRVTIDLSWTSPGLLDRSGVPQERYTPYTVNGVAAEATDIIAKFRIPCRLPGDLEQPSKEALLRAALGNTRSIGRDDPETQKRHITLLYGMAQRAVEAMGCENEPLQGEPVVQPGKR
ncbi:hypothetical protein AB0B42_03390 [Streptomyces fradiae]|uniref:hypothetical protein n=1 Tax=Streptomyces fradiae TaxID=1906 RepID=UPI0033E5C36F